MNEELLAQIINGMRMNQQQGTVGNVSNNEAAMFSGNPMNGAELGANPAIAAMRAVNNAGGAVGNVSNREAAMFNNMRNNLTTAGNVGNLSANEAVMFNANNPMNGAVAGGNVGNVSNREADFFNRLNELKKIGQNRILTDGEKQEAMFIQKMLPPVEVMPPDIDNLDLSPEALRKALEVIEDTNFRGFPMRGGR